MKEKQEGGKMSNEPHVGINWKKVGGRKFVAAFITFITAITSALAGNVLDINTLILAVCGFITFIVIEGIIDFKAVSNGSPQKVTVSGELKKRLAILEEILEHVKVGAIKPDELPATKANNDEH